MTDNTTTVLDTQIIPTWIGQEPTLRDRVRWVPQDTTTMAWRDMSLPA